MDNEPFKEGPEPVKMPVMMAMLDVLGFSGRARTDGIDPVFSLYKQLVTNVITKEPMRCLGTHDMGDGTRCPALYSADIRYTYFSDTIMLWMPLDPLFAGPFIQRCADLLCEALTLHVPLRGAVALGEAVMHKASGMYIGEPIIDAHELEEAQEWIGVAFAPSGTWSPFVAELSPIQIIEYDVPVKKGKEDLRSPLVLDWPRRWRDTRTESVSDVLTQLNTSEKHSWYYDNALAFVRYSEDHHDWHMKTDEENGFKYLRMTKRDAQPGGAPDRQETVPASR